MQGIELIEDGADDAAQAEVDRQVMAEQVASRLQGIADQRVRDRINIENEWVEDERQFQGEYDPDVLKQIAPGKSKAFYNGTRQLCEFAAARLAEMCLPTTTGRNFAIRPTPLPDLPPELAGASERIKAIADARAAAMQKVLDDQLAECDYNGEARKAIHQAVVIGTGVLKGPVVRSKTLRRYQRRELPMGVGVEYVATIEQKPTAALEWVSVWDFFPDLAAARIEDCENFLQRHWLTRKQLRNLVSLPGFNVDAIRELATNKPGFREGNYQTQLSRNATEQTDSRYQVWEFNGSLPYEDFRAIASDLGATDDPLADVRVTVWFCDGKVLKAVPQASDDDTPLYSVFQWADDSHNIFGKGLPRLIRNSQRIANSTLRMLLDNAAFSIIPQRVINRNAITPVDGSYDVRPGKEWLFNGAGDISAAFRSEAIAANLGDLITLFDKAKQSMQEESGIQMLQQNGQEPMVAETATATAMLMNSASTPLRDKVRRFDTCVTRPRITALYRWNMQFHEDDEIKGDYNVVALGSTSLLMREQRMQGLIQIVSMAQASPVFAPLTKWPELFRELVGSMEINADGFVLSDEEIKQQQEQQGQAAPDPQVLKLQIEQGKLQLAGRELQIREAEAQSKLRMAEIGAQNEMRKLAVLEQDSQNDLLRTQIQALRESDRLRSNEQMMLARIASETNKTVQQIKAQLGMKKMDMDHKNQLFNAEAAIKQRFGQGL